MNRESITAGLAIIALLAIPTLLRAVFPEALAIVSGSISLIHIAGFVVFALIAAGSMLIRR